jgi:hypothetical protein
MFTRLNEAVPLNAAEKRNSFGGPLPRLTRELVQHPFFTEFAKVSPTRYRHHDIVAKMLWITFALPTLKAVPDTKKATLDSFFRSRAGSSDEELLGVRKIVEQSLGAMYDIFGVKDELLRSAAVIPVYFILFEESIRLACLSQITRAKLSQFEEIREENRRAFQLERDNVDFKLIEYDELSQSSNDGASIGARTDLLRQYLGLPEFDIGRLM